jgi:hypothetical protein
MKSKPTKLLAMGFALLALVGCGENDTTVTDPAPQVVPPPVEPPPPEPLPPAEPPPPPAGPTP